jgi:hypothetical protein
MRGTFIPRPGLIFAATAKAAVAVPVLYGGLVPPVQHSTPARYYCVTILPIIPGTVPVV